MQNWAVLEWVQGFATCIRPDVNQPQFHLVFIQFLSDFCLILFYSEPIGMASKDSWLDNANMMLDFCITLHFFARLLKISQQFTSQRCGNKLQNVSKTKQNVGLMYLAIIFSSVWFLHAKNQRKNHAKIRRNWPKTKWNWGWFTSGPIEGTQ